ncbi:MAG: DUF1648 domain-containing protein [Phycisphaerae bacterium]|jgi:uncharacterized membrane protein
MPLARRFLFALAGLIQAALWWRAAAWYPRLPDRIPIHFDMSGTPDGWAAKSAATWFLLPGLATLLTLALMGAGLVMIPALARHKPQLINIPSKERFLALDADARAAAIAPLGTFMLFEATLLCGLFLWIVEMSGRVATGAATTAQPWPVAIVLVGSSVGVPIMLVAMMRAIERAAASRAGP